MFYHSAFCLYTIFLIKYALKNKRLKSRYFHYAWIFFLIVILLVIYYFTVNCDANDFNAKIMPHFGVNY